MSITNLEAQRCLIVEGSNEGEAPRLCFFVHGFRSDYITAWGRLASVLDTQGRRDPALSRWDYCFLGYDSLGLTSVIDVAEIICTRLEEAAAQQLPFNRQYVEFAIVAHSMGTLAVRHLLVNPHSVSSKVRAGLKCALLFGSPIVGSSWSTIAQYVPGISAVYPVLPDLALGSSFIRQLSAWADCAAGHHPWCDVYRYDAANDRVVHAGAAAVVSLRGDIASKIVAGNHNSIVQVTSPLDFLYQQLQMRLA